MSTHTFAAPKEKTRKEIERITRENSDLAQPIFENGKLVGHIFPKVTSQYQIGDVVLSQSGLSYRIFQVKHDCGAVAYRVRRLRGEQIWGPHRWLAECDVFPTDYEVVS